MSQPQSTQEHSMEEHQTFLCGNDFVAHERKKHARESAKNEKMQPFNEEKARKRGKKKWDKLEQVSRQQGMIDVLRKKADDAFKEALKKVCREEGKSFADGMAVFRTPRSKHGQPEFTYQHESMFRVAFEKKKMNNKGFDSCQARYSWNGMPILKFISTESEQLKWRPSQPYDTLGLTADVQTLHGRHARSSEERHAVPPVPAPTGNQGFAWEPWDPTFVQKVGKHEVVKAFDLWLELDNQFKTSGDARNTQERPLKEWLGERKTPQRSNAPTVKRPRASKVSINNMDTKSISLTMSNNESTNRQINEEINELKGNLRMLARLGSGAFGASTDVIYEVTAVMEASNALVWNCDFSYEPPNGSYFRSMSDTVSFVGHDFARIFDKRNDTDGKTVWDEEQEKWFLVFHDEDGGEFKLKPYAARLDGVRGEVNVCYLTLYRYYKEQYDLIDGMLKEYMEAYNLQNGGCSVERLRERMLIEDDIVFGTGRCLLWHEPIFKFHGVFPKKHIEYRLRRRRRGEEGLDENGYAIVAEMNAGLGWMAWANQKLFFAKENVWYELPFDEEEGEKVWCEPGWVPGDEYSGEVELPAPPETLPCMFE